MIHCAFNSTNRKKHSVCRYTKQRKEKSEREEKRKKCFLLAPPLSILTNRHGNGEREMLRRRGARGKTKSSAATSQDLPLGGVAPLHHHLLPLREKAVWKVALYRLWKSPLLEILNCFSVFDEHLILHQIRGLQQHQEPSLSWQTGGWMSPASIASGGTIDPLSYITDTRKTWRAVWMRTANRQHMRGTFHLKART